MPCQVKFMHGNRSQVILTEQIFTANIMDLGNYIYTVNDYILQQVEEGLLIQLAIKNNVFEETMDSFVTRMKSIVDRLVDDGKKKLLMASKMQMEEIALQLCESVEVLLDNPPTVYNAENTSNNKENIICKDNVAADFKLCEDVHIKENEISSKEKVQETHSPKCRPRWDTNMKITFLNDCESLCTEELMIKYSLRNKKAVYDRKCTLRKSLRS